MSNSQKTPSAGTVTVTIRLPSDEAANLQVLADAAQMSRSAYILRRLRMRPVELDAPLAALRSLIAIHGAATDRGTDRELLDELKTLVSLLARSVRQQSDQRFAQ